MNAPRPEVPSEFARSIWRHAVEDLRTLAWLHAAERDAATWRSLHRAGFPLGLALPDVRDDGVVVMAQVLTDLDRSIDGDPQAGAIADDELAADYADIYLTHALEASPYESVWRDDDHLMLQGPTFAVRSFYRRHGVAVPDWRAMPDDHLAHELGFVAHLLDGGEVEAAMHFLDRHLLTWLPDFARRVAQRARTTVYAGLATLTLQACLRLRERLGPPDAATDPLPTTTGCAQAAPVCGRSCADDR